MFVVARLYFIRQNKSRYDNIRWRYTIEYCEKYDKI